MTFTTEGGSTMEHEEQQGDDGEPEELSPAGHPLTEETTQHQLSDGVDIEGETPQQAHVDEHPTPEHPTGRLGP